MASRFGISEVRFSLGAGVSAQHSENALKRMPRSGPQVFRKVPPSRAGRKLRPKSKHRMAFWPFSTPEVFKRWLTLPASWKSLLSLACVELFVRVEHFMLASGSRLRVCMRFGTPSPAIDLRRTSRPCVFPDHRTWAQRLVERNFKSNGAREIQKSLKLC